MMTLRLEKDKELLSIFNVIAPGTGLREGLENILRAKTGGLLVLSDNEEILKLADGGFHIDSEYSPSYIYELAKMDGAIILSNDLKKIICANAQLMPDSSIPTIETGTRHRTADRVAKQTQSMVIAISERRNIITVYKNNIRYVLRDSSVVLERATQALQTLEKYVTTLESVISNLNILEFQDLVTLSDILMALQRTEMVLRVESEIDMYISELGNEGRLISMQLSELIKNVEQDGILIIRDYCQSSMDFSEIYKQIQQISAEGILEVEQISKTMGYAGLPLADTLISPRGYRILSKIPRIPNGIIENLIKHFKVLRSVMEASYEELDKVEGIGEARAKAIKNGLRRIKEQLI
jgi:diadenylate cyclase